MWVPLKQRPVLPLAGEERGAQVGLERRQVGAHVLLQLPDSAGVEALQLGLEVVDQPGGGGKIEAGAGDREHQDGPIAAHRLIKLEQAPRTGHHPACGEKNERVRLPHAAREEVAQVGQIAAILVDGSREHSPEQVCGPSAIRVSGRRLFDA